MTDRPTRRQRLHAIGALAGAVGSLVLVVVASAVSGVHVLLLTAGALVVGIVGAWLFVAHRAALRVAGAALAAAALVGVVVILVANRLLWVPAVAVGLLALAAAAARSALTADAAVVPPAEVRVPPPRHPFMIMNPRSGGC